MVMKKKWLAISSLDVLEKCIFMDYWKSFYFRFELFHFKAVI